MKKRVASLLSVGLLMGLILGSSTVSANQAQSNYDALCSTVGKEMASAGQAQGKSLGSIAKEAGKLVEFQQQALANKQALLTEKVAAGQITTEQATQVVETMQQNQATCDGTGQGTGLGNGLGAGACDGSGIGLGNNSQAQGNGAGQGAGMGNPSGGGNGLHDGSGAGGQQGRNAGNCVTPN